MNHSGLNKKDSQEEKIKKSVGQSSNYDAFLYEFIIFYPALIFHKHKPIEANVKMCTIISDLGDATLIIDDKFHQVSKSHLPGRVRQMLDQVIQENENWECNTICYVLYNIKKVTARSNSLD